ncbi:SagB/ThcOx family dehydrogenase [Mangrovimicrobium sediminis]|uniref:SagB/ThcOx family dehydrogenase n=1 Tax=Mangrovimicrobium sediminis TaxID=2562682 RepID=A0A4Z0M7F1_9GAMM|nr:SagB/ThcOx family dehydrogenase [Haliea sp. SAOS-164]
MRDVREYHALSRHSFQAYARGPGTIDWDRQPDPFRRFDGAQCLPLPLWQGRADAASAWFADIDASAALAPVPANVEGTGVALDTDSLGAWLEHSLALSAWKQHGGARWSVRCNPSSGNLHPTEAYLVLCGVDGLRDGLYHYRADLHALELRCAYTAVSSDEPLVLVGLSSLLWREAWKYGERAYRYCQLDIGHAVAALSYAALLNHWSLAPLAVADDTLASLLGTDRVADFIPGEEEWADCLLQLRPAADTAPLAAIPATLAAAADAGQWYGRAEVIDRRHFYEWPVLDAVARSAARPASAAGELAPPPVEERAAPLPALRGESLSALVRRRRSAQAFDSAAEMPREHFLRLLDHLLPRPGLAPWNALPAVTGSIHCVLFVHRVAGLAPGLYALPRSATGEVLMREELRAEFAWSAVADAPPQLPLYQLVGARAERAAARLSCQQAIAADGVFSLAMLAEFGAAIEDRPWRYRELFWEAGALGQALYIEAENAGLCGTGIGCFFDEPVHELLGVRGDALQSLYHFTVGRPLRDSRIVSLPPYSGRRS